MLVSKMDLTCVRPECKRNLLVFWPGSGQQAADFRLRTVNTGVAPPMVIELVVVVIGVVGVLVVMMVHIMITSHSHPCISATSI